MGYSAIHIACNGGLIKVGKVLLELGACVSKTNVKSDILGLTPQYYGFDDTEFTPLDVLAKRIQNDARKFSQVKEDILDFAWDLIERGTQYTKSDQKNANILFKRMSKARDNVRAVVVVIIGTRKYRHSNILAANDLNIIKQIAKLIWKSQRLRNGKHLVWE